VNDSVTSAMFFVLLSSTTLGSKKNVRTNSWFSPAFSVCFSKQKHPILLRYIPKGEGETLNEADPEDFILLSFVTLNLTV
jgi:hypothetical protein